VAVVEKSPKLGETCLHVGSIPTEAMIHCAEVWHYFKMSGEGTFTVTLKADTPGEVLSSQIQTDHNVEVLDRHMHVATISEGGKLNIEMRLKSGRGYVSQDRNFDEDLPVDFIRSTRLFVKSTSAWRMPVLVR